MNHIFRIYRPDRTVLLDADSYGLVFVEALTVPQVNGVFVKFYPVFSGRTLRILGRTAATIDYPSATPRISVDMSRAFGPEKLYIFAQ